MIYHHARQATSDDVAAGGYPADRLGTWVLESDEDGLPYGWVADLPALDSDVTTDSQTARAVAATLGIDASDVDLAPRGGNVLGQRDPHNACTRADWWFVAVRDEQ